MSEKPEKLRLGGMALRNGLLVHGPTHWAAAVRDDDGAIAVASGPKPRVAGRAQRLPGVRGVVRLGEAVAVIPLVKRALPAARLPFQDATVVAAMGATALAGMALRRRTRGIGGEAALAALSLAPSLIALRGGELAAYHGVEHKAIAAYEQGVEDPASVPKEHDRCGSNLIAPMLVMSAAGQLIVDRLLERPGPLARAAVGLASISVAVEMFAWSERNSESGAARAFRRPGHEIQRLIATKEPTAEQLEVGVEALRQILRVEQEASARPE